MTKKLFGTDGVRGRVGEWPITPEMVMHLGYAAGRVLGQAAKGSLEAPCVLIGKDTRVSGYMLESALEAGLSAAGVDVDLVGPMPTPAVAYLTRALRLSAGIVISASHNPFEDNGIKFFSASGDKLPDAVEREIEAHLGEPMSAVPSRQLGKARRIDDAGGRYIEFCKSTFPSHLDLRGLNVVVDCANGAAYKVAPHVFHELGADVTVIANTPDGFNINQDCGATAPKALARTVLERGADLGIAVDGDADRLVMVDARGNIYDGDQLLYAIVRHRVASGTMDGGVVGTLMTNLALERALEGLRVPFARAAVGDRYVREKMSQLGWKLGGENSGHIICLDKHTTGDALVSALQVLHALRVTGGTLEALVADLSLYPQVLINVRVARGRDLLSHPQVVAGLAKAESRLGQAGRVLLRPSGTEPLIRVMVEGEDLGRVQAAAEELAREVQAAAA